MSGPSQNFKRGNSHTTSQASSFDEEKDHIATNSGKCLFHDQISEESDISKGAKPSCFSFLQRRPKFKNRQVKYSLGVFAGDKEFEQWARENNIELGKEDSTENQQRMCIESAISAHLNRITELENIFNTDVLNKEKLFTADEISYAEKAQINRRYLLMILCRDLRTMLLFVWSLKIHNQNLVHDVIANYKSEISKACEERIKCLRCTILNRVSICLVVDKLRCGIRVLHDFVEKYSEEEEPAKPTVSRRLWEMLFNIAKEENLCVHIFKITKEVIESCGYHTDIAQCLTKNEQLQTNRFHCVCKRQEEMENLKYGMKSYDDLVDSAVPESFLSFQANLKDEGKTQPKPYYSSHDSYRKRQISSLTSSDAKTAKKGGKVAYYYIPTGEHYNDPDSKIREKEHLIESTDDTEQFQFIDD